MAKNAQGELKVKAILLSIRPEWLVKILNREKTIEVRKLFRKDYVGWIYLYCSKGNDRVWKENDHYWHSTKVKATQNDLNGKVVARFWCDKVEELVDYGSCYLVNKDYPHTNEIARQSCLDFVILKNYLKGKNGYVIHISKLEIFDRPKELGEFKTYKTYNLGDLHNCHLSLTKAPQNYCYVEGE